MDKNKVYNNHGATVSTEDLKNIHSINDPIVQKLMEDTPEGKHPYYYSIGVLGGNAVKEKYKNMNKK